MAELLTLDFAGVDQATYARINAELGLDPSSGAGDWPAGLITHLAGVSEDGHCHVVEVWESQQAQADFMHDRLGAALAAGGVTATPQGAWAHVMGHHDPGR